MNTHVSWHGLARSALVAFLLGAPAVASAQGGPAITSLSPNSATAGTPAFTITVAGSNFTGNSIVLWNGLNRTTTFVSPSQLSAAIPATDIAAPGTASVTVLNPIGTPGAGTSNALPFIINAASNPAPTITTLTPASAEAGGPAFTLTITGTNYLASSMVRWNGANRTTTFLSSTQLAAAISSADIASPGSAFVTVFNPAPGGGVSNAAQFNITPAATLPPTITNLIPSSAQAGAMSFSLTVIGVNFISSSQVRWNGSPRSTTFVSSNQLSAQIPATDIASPGLATISVLNPGSGGGVSNGLSFTITPPPNSSPTITSIGPHSTAAGGPAFTLLISGSNFIISSTVRWNGATRPTTFLSANQLTAAILASDISQPGMATVTVVNPGPNGGASNAIGFTIGPALNPSPVIVTLSPSSAIAGEGRLRLAVTGTGFIPQSVVQWNNTDRPTTFISATQLVAMILSSDLQRPGVGMVAVLNPGPGGGRSAAIPLAITVGPLVPPPPTLTAIGSSVVTQGATNVTLTLVGSNFRPGARVIISDPSTDALDPAQEILVQSSTFINETTMSTIISIGPNARLGLMRVDVLNGDGSNTGPAGSRTSKSLRIEAGSSLGAPLAVRSLMITHPRDATVIGAGEEVIAEAIIGGAGTGTLTGQWLWDGNVIEQFAVNLTGGEPARVKSSRPLPTAYLGSHRLELRITHPNSFNSSPLQIVVNPGASRLLRLLTPRWGEGFTLDAPPLLRWAIVPDAVRYQVGLSTQPHVRMISQWHDVEDTQWQVPEKIWAELPEGLLYWTVRAAGPTGELRKPAPMRRIYRLKKGALQSSSPQPQGNGKGHALLEWEGLNLQAVYRIAVSRDREGKEIVCRLMTLKTHLDLRDLRAILGTIEGYYWSVEALEPSGHSILTSPPRPFTVGRSEYRIQPGLTQDPREPVRVVTLDRSSSKVSAVRELLRDAGDRVALSRADPANDITLQLAGRDALPDHTVRESRPSIRLESRSTPIPSDVAVVLDELDVTALATIEGGVLSFTPAIPLSSGPHQLALRIGGQTVNWRFIVAPAGREESSVGVAPGNDAEKVNQEASLKPTGNGPEFNIDTASNTQWTSGSEADTNVITIGAQVSYTRGPWRLDMNGGGLLNNMVAPQPRHMLGRFNEYVFRVAHEQKNWGETLRLGTIIPEMYTGAEFMAVAIPRHSVEAGLRTPIGRFAFYTTASDARPAEAQGIALPDTVEGASFDPRIPGERIKFRVMWIGARDRDGQSSIPVFGVPVSPVSNSRDAFGGVLTLTLGKVWTWTSEYVAVAIEGAQRSRALRTGLAGAVGKTTLAIAYRDVAEDYSSPGNLSPLGAADRRGLDAAFIRPTRFGAFNVSYQFLQSDVRSVVRPAISLQTGMWSWSKSITRTTVLSLGGNLARTFSEDSRTTAADSSELPVILIPSTDQTRIGITTTATQSLGQLMLTVGGSRNWSRDEINPGQNNINSMTSVNVAWTPRTFFQLQSSMSVNWLAGDGLTVGQTRTFTAYIQPTLAWKRTGLQVMPLLTLSTTDSRLGNGTRMVDMLMTQYGGRAAWQMPGRLQFSTLSFESNYARTRDRLFGSSLVTPRLLVVWTIVKTAQRRQ